MIFRAMKSCSLFNGSWAIYYEYLHTVTTFPARFHRELISSADKAHTEGKKKGIRSEETIALRKSDFIFHLHVE